MATTAINNLVYPALRNDRLLYPVDSSGSNDFNQGDMLYFTSNQARATGSDGNNATFCGVAADTPYKSPYGTKIYDPMANVIFDGIFFFKSAAVTFNMNDALYYSTDAQTVTNAAATNITGYFQLFTGQATGVVGGSGVNVLSLIVPKSPTTAIAG